MKSKRKEWLQVITAGIGVSAFGYLIGQVGNSDLNRITYEQLVFRCTISTAIIIAARFSYWKIGQANEY